MDASVGGVPLRHRESGVPAAVAVLLWVFVGWPLSWLLLFFSGPVGILFGIAITAAMLVVVVGGGRRARPVAVLPPVPDPRRAAARREVEGWAHIDAAGGCGWCGSRTAHVNDSGYPVHPRHWHAGEVEERLRELS